MSVAQPTTQIKETTALRKIAGLKKRIWGLQGGQGSGKTFSVGCIVINHASSVPGREIYVVSAELSKMRDTVIKDFLKIIDAFGLQVKASGIAFGPPRIDFSNGSFIRFLGLDKDDVGKGLRSHVVFINEANKIKSFDSIREITSRAERVIYDFNPNRKFWFHQEILPREDCGFLVTTFLDNEYLSDTERAEILKYKAKGYDPQGNVINEYWANMWRVYGLGEIGSVEGRIFHWKSIPYNEFLKIDVPVYYSVDWGTQDPFAIGCEKYYDGTLYTHELNYDSENAWFKKLSQTQIQQIRSGNDEGFVTWLFNRLQIPKNRPIICDNNRQNKIIALRKAGWEQAVAIKKPPGSKMDGIDILQSMNVAYTANSTNIEYEQEVYHWKKDKAENMTDSAGPVDADDHHMDRIRYTALYMHKNGIIRKV